MGSKIFKLVIFYVLLFSIYCDDCDNILGNWTGVIKYSVYTDHYILCTNHITFNIKGSKDRFFYKYKSIIPGSESGITNPYCTFYNTTDHDTWEFGTCQNGAIKLQYFDGNVIKDMMILANVNSPRVDIELTKS